MNPTRLAAICIVIPLLSGCALKEVRSKTKFGPEFRHSSGSGTSKDRWSVQQGVELKWDEGVSTALTYRRRDDNSGDGNNDNGVWFEFSFPLWKADKKPAGNPERMGELEERLAELEKQVQEISNAG